MILTRSCEKHNPQQYAGLSGVLHGLVAWGACTWLQQPAERRWGLLVLAGLGLKLMDEAAGGSVDTARWIGALVVVQAHVGKGLVMKRHAPRARGRVGRIFKPFSHLTIIVREVEAQQA